jgi:hypothetical protein
MGSAFGVSEFVKESSFLEMRVLIGIVLKDHRASRNTFLL